MAGNKPGPAKGEGGRPRTKKHAPNGEGYVQKTVGPPSKGKRVYEHRAVKGVGPGTKSGSGGVVDHKNGNRQDNRPSNLRVVSKKENRANIHKKG